MGNWCIHAIPFLTCVAVNFPRITENVAYIFKITLGSTRGTAVALNNPHKLICLLCNPDKLS